MTAAATTLKNILFGNWSLTGELSKVSVDGSNPPATTMDEVVQFFDRLQVVGNEVTKAVIVEKINAEGNEGIIKHPNYNELTDTYELTVRYRVLDVNASNYSEYLDFVEQMATEVVRILKTVYNPASTENVYFQTMNNWVNLDVDVGNQRDLRRQLRFTLTTITSDDPDVYTGFGGVLVFDGPASSADDDDNTLVNYTFVSVKNIDCEEGFSQIPTLTKDVTFGVGVPLLMRGQFSGRFSALMYAEKNNIIGTTVEKLQNIYRLQTESALVGQNAEIVLLRTNTNTEVVDSVTQIRVTNPGSGYTSDPAVSFDVGDGAVATANRTDEQVTSIQLSAKGDDYTAPPIVTIAAPTTGITATAQAVIVDNKVEEVIILNPGSGYDSDPAVSFSSVGSGADASVTRINGQISSIEVVTGGSGFTSPPIVTIAAPTSGITATAVAIILPTLTRKSFMRINQLKENTPDQDLVSYTITGTLSRPTIFTENS